MQGADSFDINAESIGALSKQTRSKSQGAGSGVNAVAKRKAVRNQFGNIKASKKEQ